MHTVTIQLYLCNIINEDEDVYEDEYELQDDNIEWINIPNIENKWCHDASFANKSIKYWKLVAHH